MRKIFICLIIFLSGVWYFTIWKAKNSLTKIIYNITDEKPDISYDTKGFPFNLIFHIKNPKYSNMTIENDQLTISSESLLVKIKFLDRSLQIYVPNNEINIVVHGDKEKNIKCITNSENHFIIKLNSLLSSSKFEKSDSIIDYINTIFYEDHGLKCDILSDPESKKVIITEVNHKPNHVRFDFNKESESSKLGFDSYIYRFKSTIHSEDYLSIDTKFDCELIGDISASKVNFDLEKFLIHTNKFSLTASGRMHDYNLTTFAFKDKIDIQISNYKEFVLSMLDNKSAADAYQKLIFSLSEKIIDDDIQFTIRYDEDMGSSFIGKLTAADLIDKFSEITKDESSN